MKVSVLLVTYNHDKYIAQAMDSIMMQKVDFDYEIIISEDCSTDSTRGVVMGFQKKYPDKIRLLLSEKNINDNSVIVRGIQAAEGQYIAYLDGDDYWVSPYKLQKQVDFLDNHVECTMCFHNAVRFYEDDKLPSENYNPAGYKEILTIEDILWPNPIASCSVMFRRGLFEQFPDWYHTCPWGDWPLHLLNAQYGNIGYINEVMGAYRVHSGGEWSKQSYVQKLEQVINICEDMNAAFNFKYDKILKRVIYKHYYYLAIAYNDNDNLAKARSCVVKCVFAHRSYRPAPLENLAKLWLQLSLKQWLKLYARHTTDHGIKF